MDETLQKLRIRIINLRHAADRQVSPEDLIAGNLGLARETVSDIDILRRATDARQERIDIVYSIAVTVEVETGTAERLLSRPDISRYQEQAAASFPPAIRRGERPVVIGSGPAGLFAALALVKRGIPPVVIERGERIGDRARTVELFWRQGLLNPESNVLYGEGGAGTFSDGKLTARTKSHLKNTVYKTLVDYGADVSIMSEAKPHIGTDRLQKIIPALVDDLQRQGADFLFQTRVSDISICDGRVAGLTAGGKHLPADTVFLACGHSSRDLYRLLHARGVRIEHKGFAVGLRIEHPQEFIDKALLGRWSGHPSLGHADYFLTHKDPETGRGVYSFCMCPGGHVIGCSTRDGELCTNGMSSSGRDAPAANAAIVAAVREDDFAQFGPLGGIALQERLEKEAFAAGGGGFFAPVQSAADFIACRAPDADWAPAACSYNPGVQPFDLNRLLPEFVSGPLRRALAAFDARLPGFAREGIVLGVETRTSSPVRIVRDSRTLHALGARGLIPAGEGSGYAGGIVSSAIDGLRAALDFDS